MKPHDIRACVREYLELIENDSRSPQECKDLLPMLLDKLAYAQHFGNVIFDDREYPDPPRTDYGAVRQIISRRFPDYGFYNLPESVLEKIGQSEMVIGDAIDDITDIASDLMDVEWRWNNTSEMDALWNFHNSYLIHWNRHLRELQLYLMDR